MRRHLRSSHGREPEDAARATHLDPGCERDRFLYDQAMRTIEIFLDWRHKIMTFTFSVTGALVALFAWMEDHDRGRASALPLALGGLLAGASLLFDQRNQGILQRCYDAGKELAKERFDQPDGGPFGWIQDKPKRFEQLFSYHRVLAAAYLLLALGLLGGAVYVFACGS